ncbi:unnamed protein product, partial [Effrenium voratum]
GTRTDAMAREITVRQLSGKADLFRLTDRTVRELKRELHGWLPCNDESKRTISSVGLVVGDRPLLNNEEMLSDAIPGAEVTAFLCIKPVTCSSASTAGCKLEDLRVVEIPEGEGQVGFEAFKYCRFLASVTMPDSVTRIDESAFQDCSSLADVAMSNCVTEIGALAFWGYGSLTSVTIPMTEGSLKRKVTASSGGIGCSAFEKCRSLRNVTIPSSVSVIGQNAFEDCCSLTSVAIPDSVSKIGGSAFRSCSSLASLTLPRSVTEIGCGAFQGCRSLASVAIPNSVTEMGKCPFQGCSLLAKATISNSLT